MDTAQRSLFQQAMLGLRQPAVWVICALSILLGLLCGWILFGEPHKIDKVFAEDGLLEWVTAAATILIGFGAWKYARATHFHTLDRADQDLLTTLDSQLIDLFVYRRFVIQANEGKSSVLAGRQSGVLQAGVAALLISATKESVDAIDWPDGRALVRSDSATLLFVEIQGKAKTFSRICGLIEKYFDKESAEEMDATQQHFYKDFERSAMELAEAGEKLLDAMKAEVDTLREQMALIRRRRAQREHVFNFDP